MPFFLGAVAEPPVIAVPHAQNVPSSLMARAQDSSAASLICAPASDGLMKPLVVNDQI
ncbi:MAG: hypothetical protein GXY28_11760 [Bacteriovoracaceae bacterium]|nr:hypothetical protein [Deltaproteobacteria bacterium]MDI9543017.1 hypothetical protein [Pseudomonadota bacterium]NLW68461.1 hypothetical protein [Bacteriovoracaceae bacterium]HRR20809.1 hypothetical protein [Desulfomonilia bacterium]HPX48870.1 hypothetical protein [Deltaproteobacteria bacterium]